MRITEEEKKQILSKYENNTSDELLTYLKRNYPTYTMESKWIQKPWKQIFIEDKSYIVEHNKKRLVNILSNILEEKWVHLDIKVLRRTIKKYIDGISL